MKETERIDRWCDDLISALSQTRKLVDRGREAFDEDPALPLAFETLSNRVGDLAEKLTTAEPERFKDPIWSLAARNRDFTVHHYRRLDADALWRTVTFDFPRLETALGETRIR